MEPVSSRGAWGPGAGVERGAGAGARISDGAGAGAVWQPFEALRRERHRGRRGQDVRRRHHRRHQRHPVAFGPPPAASTPKQLRSGLPTRASPARTVRPARRHAPRAWGQGQMSLNAHWSTPPPRPGTTADPGARGRGWCPAASGSGGRGGPSPASRSA